MALTGKEIGLFSPDNRRVKQLLQELFLRRKRLGVGILSFRSLWRTIEYFGYYDETGAFRGFSYVIFSDKMAYVHYLAVDSSVQSRGYGGAIMRAIAARHPGKELAVTSEARDERADNAEQREKRIRFYERCGLHETGYVQLEKKALYSIMSSATPFALEEYLHLLKQYGFGMYRPKISKAPERK